MATLAAPPRLRFIDSDVHPIISSAELIYPYMTDAWRIKFRNAGFELGPLFVHPRYAHPMGETSRADAIPRPGAFAGSDPGFMQSDYMNQYGPEKLMLIPLNASKFVSFVDRNAIAEIFRACNEYFIHEWLPKDERFMYALLAVPQDPVAAAAEIRRVGRNKQVNAVFVPLVDKLLGDSWYHPIYDAAAEIGLPILTHPTGQEGSFLGCPTTAGGIPTSYIERYCDLPQIAEANCCSLVFEGTFDKFPTLRVVFTEWGFSWLGGLLWRMDKVWRALRRETPWVQRMPSEIVADHMRFTTQPLDEPKSMDQFEAMLDIINAEKVLLFSTDYPHWDNDMPTHVFTRQSDDLRKKIYFDNPAELWKRAMT